MLRQEFALILMDVAMPGPRRLRDRRADPAPRALAHTPIIFLTANVKSDTHVFRGYSVGAVDYLFKPFVPEVLLSKVAVFVELYTKRQAIKESAEALKRAYDEMEQRVEERTERAGARPIGRSQAEMAERQRVEIERAQLLEREQRGAPRGAGDEPDEGRVPRAPSRTSCARRSTPSSAGRTSSKSATATTRRSTRATRVIKNNAQAQAQLVADILDVSRIIGGKLNLHLGLVNLRRVIEAALEAVQPAADAKGIAIDDGVRRARRRSSPTAIGCSR